MWLWEVDHPYLHGLFAPVDADVHCDDLGIAGDLPADLEGCYVVNPLTGSKLEDKGWRNIGDISHIADIPKAVKNGANLLRTQCRFGQSAELRLYLRLALFFR